MKIHPQGMKNRPQGHAFWIRLVMVWATVAALAVAVGCQTPAGRSAGQVIDDGTITAKVKAAYFDDPRLSGMQIDVDTFEGEVTLTGAVRTVKQKQYATRVAYDVRGVRQVNNLLKVR